MKSLGAFHNIIWLIFVNLGVAAIQVHLYLCRLLFIGIILHYKHTIFNRKHKNIQHAKTFFISGWNEPGPPPLWDPGAMAHVAPTLIGPASPIGLARAMSCLTYSCMYPNFSTRRLLVMLMVKAGYDAVWTCR
jgi:hypothetical protein